MEPILEISNLCKEYDNFKLKNLNLTIEKGSIMGFIGENGAGKTTTIKLILNMIEKNKGTIKLFGKDFIGNEQELKQQIGVVLDEGYFYESFTPIQINKVMRQLQKTWDTSLFFSYLTKFNLPKTKPMKTYSKGMKMKLYIATALSHRPKLLILDEPTSGLDPVVRSEILDIFLEFIQDEEHAILFSTHITSDLDKIADYITLLHEGECILSKNKDEIFSEYGILKCGNQDFSNIEKKDYIRYRKNRFGYELLITHKREIQKKYPTMVLDPITIEEIMLFYIKGEV